jgi:hypothetical protein
VDDDFGVCLGIEAVAAGDQAFSEFRVVEYLAIVHDPQGVVFVVDGLVTAGKVDDAQPGVGQSGRPVGVDAGRIGAAVVEESDHPAEGGLVRGGDVKIYYACYAAHLHQFLVFSFEFLIVENFIIFVFN